MLTYSKDNMEVHEAVELIAYLCFDGKISQVSKFEKQLCDSVLDQIENNSDMSHRTLALCWIYYEAFERRPYGQFTEVVFLLGFF